MKLFILLSQHAWLSNIVAISLLQIMIFKLKTIGQKRSNYDICLFDQLVIINKVKI